MDPITLALLASAGMKAVGGLAQGVGTARAGKKMMLTPEEEQLQRELAFRQRTGDAFTERQRAGLEAKFQAAQAGAGRELQAQALQQAAARQAGGGVSGRDIFLREQAAQSVARGARQQQNLAVEELNQQALAAQREQLAGLRAQQKQAEAMRAQGIGQAVSGAFGAAGEVAGMAAAMRQETDLAGIEAEAKAEPTESILNRYRAPTAGGFSFTFGA